MEQSKSLLVTHNILTEKQIEINTNDMLDRMKKYADKSDEEIYICMTREDCEYLTNGIPKLLSRIKTYCGLGHIKEKDFNDPNFQELRLQQISEDIEVAYFLVERIGTLWEQSLDKLETLVNFILENKIEINKKIGGVKNE